MNLRHADIERDSEQEEHSDPQASGDQEPGACWAPRGNLDWFSGSIGLESSNEDHAAKDGGSRWVEDP